jgi:chromosome segregation ATPase
MELSLEAIQTRKSAIQEDITKLRETITQLDTKRQELVNNLNALSGAEQQCDHFISLIEEENEDVQTTS